MKIFTGWPSMRPSAAKAIPVLPPVASEIVKPGSIFPSVSACRKMRSAMRSLMLPVRLRYSLLAQMTRSQPR